MTDHLASIRSQGTSPSLLAETLLPALRAWLCEPSQSTGDPEPMCFVEVGFQTGTSADNYSVRPPDALDPSRPWFWVGFARQTPEREAVVLWFAPEASLLALRERAEWDTGNALGFDFIAAPGAEMQQLLQVPLLRDTLDAFAVLAPAAIELSQSVQRASGAGAG